MFRLELWSHDCTYAVSLVQIGKPGLRCHDDTFSRDMTVGKRDERSEVSSCGIEVEVSSS